MKLSEKLARLKWSKMKQADRAVAREQRGGLGARRAALAILCILLAAGATWAVLEFFVWQKVPAALIGVWQVKDGPMQGGTFAFTRNGTLAIRTGQGQDMDAHIAVQGKKLLTTTRHPMTAREETHASIIQELTETTLILELEKGAVLRLERIN